MNWLRALFPISVSKAQHDAIVTANRELAAALGREVLAHHFAQATNVMLQARCEQLFKELNEARAENAVLRGGEISGTA